MSEKIGIIMTRCPGRDDLELTIGTKTDAERKEIEGYVVGFKTSPAIRRELARHGITSRVLLTDEPPEN